MKRVVFVLLFLSFSTSLANEQRMLVFPSPKKEANWVVYLREGKKFGPLFTDLQKECGFKRNKTFRIKTLNAFQLNLGQDEKAEALRRCIRNSSFVTRMIQQAATSKRAISSSETVLE